MATRHETAILALLAALGGMSVHPTLEEDLPDELGANGLVNLRPGEPEEVGETLGSLDRDWQITCEVELVVRGATSLDRRARMDDFYAEIGTLLTDVTLGGAVDFLRIEAAQQVEDIPIAGAASLKGSVVPVELYYQTSNNPMETV